MTRTQAAVVSLNALPLELCLLIASEYVADSDHNPRAVVRLTHIDARMRNLLVNTSELWSKFSISCTESSHKLGDLFILRSGGRVLDILISLHWCLLEEEFGSFFDWFLRTSKRIARLSIYINDQASLSLLSSLLGAVGLPLLEHVEVEYDDETRGFGGRTSLPSDANLRSISLTGVQIDPSDQPNLNNITYIHLGAGKQWRWTSMSLISFLRAATSLQELHFVGGKGISTGDGPEGMPFTLPALRRVRFLNTAPGLITSFLYWVDAPLLEEVEMTTPSHRNQKEEVFGAVAARVAMRNPSLSLPVRTLTIRDAEVKCSVEDLYFFVVFLTVMFPHVATLEAGAVFLDILRICIVLADKRPLRLGRPLVWMGVETLKVCVHFDHETEEVYGKVVEYITDSLQTLKEKGVMNLQELRLSVDPSLQPPAGRVSVEALSGLVGKLILDDYWPA